MINLENGFPLHGSNPPCCRGSQARLPKEAFSYFKSNYFGTRPKHQCGSGRTCLLIVQVLCSYSKMFRFDLFIDPVKIQDRLLIPYRPTAPYRNRFGYYHMSRVRRDALFGNCCPTPSYSLGCLVTNVTRVESAPLVRKD